MIEVRVSFGWQLGLDSPQEELLHLKIASENTLPCPGL